MQKITRTGDMEPRCPACGNENAMLGFPNLYCRDCGHEVLIGDVEVVRFTSIKERDAWQEERAERRRKETGEMRQGIYIQVVHETLSDGSKAPRVLIQDARGNDIGLDAIDDKRAYRFMGELAKIITKYTVETPVVF